jgi:hypothetical protein
MLAYVFITCDNKRELHVGVTLSLVQTLYLSKVAFGESSEEPVFDRLVYFEKCTNICNAYSRQHELESETPEHLCLLVESRNRDWVDLSATWFPVSSHAVVMQKTPEHIH